MLLFTEWLEIAGQKILKKIKAAEERGGKSGAIQETERLIMRTENRGKLLAFLNALTFLRDNGALDWRKPPYNREIQRLLSLVRSKLGQQRASKAA